MILHEETYNGFTITVKPNAINASRIDDEGYLKSRSFIGYTMDEVKEILDEGRGLKAWTSHLKAPCCG